MTMIETVADAIDAARYAHPEHPRERPIPFAQAHPTDREYALRMARAAIRAILGSDEMLRAAVKADVPDRIQGFSTPLPGDSPKWGAPHYVRDVYKPRAEQELWRGDSHDEMMERCAMERMRVVLAAALADAHA